MLLLNDHISEVRVVPKGNTDREVQRMFGVLNCIWFGSLNSSGTFFVLARFSHVWIFSGICFEK